MIIVMWLRKVWCIVYTASDMQEVLCGKQMNIFSCCNSQIRITYLREIHAFLLRMTFVH